MSVESNKRMRAAYDRWAEEYARINANLPPMVAEMLEVFSAELQPRARVLDVGCGHGRDMARLEAVGFNLVGIDLSAEMLGQARRIVRGPLAQMDMRHIAFEAGTFGGAWCMASMLHLSKEDAPAALAEIRRVLEAGAPLLIGLQEGSSEGWELNPGGEIERFFARYERREAVRMLEAAGFTVAFKRYEDAGVKRWLQYLCMAAA